MHKDIDIHQRYFDLLEAIEAERKTEEQYFLELSHSKTRQEKIDAGILISPLILLRSYYTLGEWVEIEVENPPRQITHSFKDGKGCVLTSKRFEVSYHGTISYSNRKVIRCIFRNDEIMSDIATPDSSLTLELTYDDRPFKVMKKAIKKVIATRDPLISNWKESLAKRKDLTGHDPLSKHSLVNVEHTLNEDQIAAVEGSLSANSMAIIHGPPGTGKTTTLTFLIASLIRARQQVLVCAPSNHATDLLAIKLHEMGCNVLRIGNITRIGDRVSHLTLDEKVRSHNEWHRIKKVKMDAEDARKKALTFKRNYGPDEKIQRSILLREAKDLKKWAQEWEDRITEDILSGAGVICTTLISSELSILDNRIFSCLVIDEASQALEPECWVAMLKARKVIFAGDHMQLPPTVRSKVAEEKGLTTTILDTMTSILHHSYLLRCQYRMNNDILDFPNKKFYDGKLYSDESVRFRKISPGDQPVTFIDTAGCGFEEELGKNSMSLKNEGEYFILREFIHSIKERLLGRSIGVISPYAEQVRFIRNAIQEEEIFQGLDIEVDTVDGFQGQEKECIFLSLVRSNTTGQIGFLSDSRRLNVALTRAMMKVVIIGDSSTVGNHLFYSDLIQHIENQYSYRSAWEWMTY